MKGYFSVDSTKNFVTIFVVFNKNKCHRNTAVENHSFAQNPES